MKTLRQLKNFKREKRRRKRRGDEKEVEPIHGNLLILGSILTSMCKI
jgi:hypothetical protein